jgi:hypothetical protein
MRNIAAALLFLVVGCNKHSQDELDQAAHDLDRAAHHTASAVSSSAAEDADKLARELHDVDDKLRSETDQAAHAVDDSARRNANAAAAALQRRHDDLEARLSAARATRTGSDDSDRK